MDTTPFQGYTLVTATQSAFNKYATFSGRATRSEYWWFYLASFLISLASTIVFGLLVYSTGAEAWSLLDNLVTLALFLPELAVCVRRLHDTGRSAWNLCWLLLPIVGCIILIVYLCGDSQPGTNQYGPSEKYPEL